MLKDLDPVKSNVNVKNKAKKDEKVLSNIWQVTKSRQLQVFIRGFQWQGDVSYPTDSPRSSKTEG